MSSSEEQVETALQVWNASADEKVTLTPGARTYLTRIVEHLEPKLMEQRFDEDDSIVTALREIFENFNENELTVYHIDMIYAGEVGQRYGIWQQVSPQLLIQRYLPEFRPPACLFDPHYLESMINTNVLKERELSYKAKSVADYLKEYKLTADNDALELINATIVYFEELWSQADDQKLLQWLQTLPNYAADAKQGVAERLHMQVMGLIIASLLYDLKGNSHVQYEHASYAVLANPYFDFTSILDKLYPW